jgi:hypothetical protein
MIIITILTAAIVGAVTAGVILLARAGITREESDLSLLGEPSTRAAAATRRVVGLYVRAPQVTTRREGQQPISDADRHGPAFPRST